MSCCFYGNYDESSGKNQQKQVVLKKKKNWSGHKIKKLRGEKKPSKNKSE